MSENPTIQETVTKIQACDCSKPYVYVSYSTRDGEKVYNDIVALQAAGKNIWIDIPANFNTGEGYNSTIFAALKNENCKGILLYLSEHSATSAQSAKEACYSMSAAVKETHENGLPICVVALEDIANDDVELWTAGKLERAFGSELLSTAEVERIEKYREKYNNKMERMDTKYDLAKAVAAAVTAQSDGMISYTEDDGARVTAVAALLA
jgi:ABC-type branched-subunit amino acid transport system substrate-binding protein